MDNDLFKIRKAVVTDAIGIATVHIDSWKTTYSNIVPDEYLSNLSYDSREKMWTNAIPFGDIYVVENGIGEIVGFSKGGKERSCKYKGYDGEIYAIYILQKYQGKGIGTALVKPIIKDIIEVGINSMLVLVLEDTNSRKFYESLGGKKLRELVYGWDDIRTIF